MKAKALSLVALLAVSLVACAAPEATGTTPAATQPAAVPSASATSAPALQKRDPDITIVGPANDGIGEYLQTGISDDAEAMQPNEQMTPPEVLEHFNQEDVNEAQKIAVRFVAEEGLDSIVMADPGNYDRWWAENEDRFHPEVRDWFSELDEEGKFPILVADEMPKWRADYGYGFVYGPERTRVVEREITYTGAYLPTGDKLGIGFFIDWSVAMEVTPDLMPDAEKRGLQTAEGEYAVLLQRDESGEFKIAGYKNKFDGTTG